MTYFRHPTLADGPQIFSLIANCPPLDQNSRYCNLLQSSHFSITCAGAWQGEVLLGFVSGYLLPTQPNVYFVWQIAVSAEARGQNLAQRLLDFVLSAAATRQVTHLQTTITADNLASQRVFQKLAERYQGHIECTQWLDQEQHFAGVHASEWLYTIGPLQLPRASSSTEEA
jgi:L-2,4-diaminobutyric acid acetyltransferase